MPVDVWHKVGILEASGSQAAALLLGELGPAAQMALPALERELADRNSVTRVLAAQAIWRISRNPKPVLPVLLSVLDGQKAPVPGSGPDSTNFFALFLAFETIEEMGGAAREAIPALERVRLFSMPAWRAANQALASINAPGP